MKNITKKIICNGIENNIDPMMISYDFQRRQNSLIYLRSIDTTKQKIEINFFSNPSYHSGAMAHIYPLLSVYYPKVNEVANKIFGDIRLIENMKNKTINQPIQLGYDHCERWMLMDDNEIDKMAVNISFFLETNTIPFLNELKSVDGFIKQYEMKDKRLFMDDVKYMFIISAYVVQGDWIKGQEVLVKRFGKPGARKQYASAFYYFENILKSNAEYIL